MKTEKYEIVNEHVLTIELALLYLILFNKEDMATIKVRRKVY